MIKDNIKNAKNYSDLSEHIKLGLEYLADTDFSVLANGKYKISGNEVFAIVQDYLSKPIAEGQFEAHKKYIDIQYIVKGEEQIGVLGIENFSESTNYDENKDIVFLSPNTNCMPEFVQIKAKEFLILFPNDAHKPSIATKSPSYVKKIVIKALL